MARSKRVLPLVEEEGESLDGVFHDLVHGRQVSKRRNSIALLAEIEAINPEKMQQFYSALEGGASFRSAAGFLGIRPETLSRWIARGQTAKSGPYKRFYDKALSHLQVAAAFANIDIKKRDPMAWLTRGPGKLVGDDWSAEPTQVNVEVSGGVTQNGLIRVETVDMLEALKELQKAGVPLETLTQTHANLAKLSTSQDEDEPEEDEGSSGEGAYLKRGTNFVEGGTYESHNPSLPDALLEQVERRVGKGKGRTIQGASIGSLLASLGLADEADNVDAKTLEGRVLYAEDKAKRTPGLPSPSHPHPVASPASTTGSVSPPETISDLASWGADWKPLKEVAKPHPRAKDLPVSQPLPEARELPEVQPIKTGELRESCKPKPLEKSKPSLKGSQESQPQASSKAKSEPAKESHPSSKPSSKGIGDPPAKSGKKSPGKKPSKPARK